jgi:predicted amidohydrolase
MSKNTRIAMAQMLVQSGKKEANLERAQTMIRRASREGADLILLPECLDLGWTNPLAGQLADPIPGATSRKLCRAASDCEIFVVAGLSERLGKRIYNSSLIISPSGDILSLHRKINILDIAGDLYSVGDRLTVVDTALGKLSTNICADNFPATLFLGRSLGRMGAEMILSPCAWAVDSDHDNKREPYGKMWRKSYTTLSSEFGISIIGVSNVGWIRGGPWNGRKCIGCSLAVGRKGQILAQLDYGEDAEQMHIVEISPPA